MMDELIAVIEGEEELVAQVDDESGLAAQIDSIPTGGGAATEVIVTPKLTEGVEIADISVDGLVSTLYAPEGGDSGVELTWADYEALPDSEKMNGTVYYITDRGGGGGGGGGSTVVVDPVLTEGTLIMTIAVDGKVSSIYAPNGGSIDVDDALSETSENPVQNKIITGVVDGLDGRVTTLENSYVSGETIYTDAEVAADIAAVLGGAV